MPSPYYFSNLQDIITNRRCSDMNYDKADRDIILETYLEYLQTLSLDFNPVSISYFAPLTWAVLEVKLYHPEDITPEASLLIELAILIQISQAFLLTGFKTLLIPALVQNSFFAFHYTKPDMRRWDKFLKVATSNYGFSIEAINLIRLYKDHPIKLLPKVKDMARGITAASTVYQQATSPAR